MYKAPDDEWTDEDEAEIFDRVAYADDNDTIVKGFRSNLESSKFASIGMVLLGAWAVRVLLLFGYHSTDFEVHRNWLAVTQLPVRQWYTEATSMWTLDYPPFFAWYEALLGLGAAWVDPGMLELRATAYVSTATVLYQRSTVILSELLLIWALRDAARTIGLGGLAQVWALVLFYPALVFVDHIHFQYNGVLLGLYMIVLVQLMRSRDVLAAALFTVLLFSKHLFLYAAPAVGWLLLMRALRKPRPIIQLFLLATATAVPAAIAVGPIFVQGQTSAMLSRLFPFGRGLTHSYWAPNAWALYNACEKVLAVVGPRYMGWDFGEYPEAVLTGGLTHTIGAEAHGGASSMDLVTPAASSHIILPSVRPIHTIGLTLLFLLPMLLSITRKLLFTRQPIVSAMDVVIWTTHSTWTFYMFAWHVHEKAALIFTVPLLLCARNPAMSDIAYLSSATAATSLMPLIHPPTYSLLKWSYLVVYLLVFLAGWEPLRTLPAAPRLLANLYCIGLTSLPIFEVLLPLLLPRLPFLPLLLYSTYCGVGFSFLYLVFSIRILMRS